MKRVIVYDVNDDSPAGKWWKRGDRFFGATGARIVRAESVDDALNRLVAMAALAGVQIEVWCHAYPASFVIGRQRFNLKTVTNDERVALLGAKLGPEGTFWIRGCSAFASSMGHAFAGALADKLGCRVAGHTHYIGTFQGGLRTLLPGETPTWDPKEGEAGGEPGVAHTTRTTPRTIFAMQSTIPAGWRDGKRA